jgi:hypothetical protein
MIRIDDKWASISIDMIRGITHLIHPAESAKPYSKVLDAHRSMMEVLTLNAMTHMAKLANRNPPNGSWEYDVALKDGIVMRWYVH